MPQYALSYRVKLRASWSFLEAADISHQLGHAVGPNFRSKSRHFSSSLSDDFGQFCIRFVCYFAGTQIFGLHGLASGRTAAAIVRMTQRTVRLEDLGRIGLGPQARRED